jgi:hypothetical protein
MQSEESFVAEQSARLSQREMSFAMNYHHFICFILRGAVTPCQRCEIDCHFLSGDPAAGVFFFCPHLTCNEWWILPKLALCFGKCIMRNFLASREGRRIQFLSHDSRTNHKCPLKWVPRPILSRKIYLFRDETVEKRSAALRRLLRLLGDDESNVRLVSSACEVLFCGTRSVFGARKAEGWREWK